MQRSSTKRPDLRHIRVAIPYSLQHGIAPKVTPTTSSTATPQYPKPTLLNIPREICDQILDNLLTSPVLGTGASLYTKLNGTEIPIPEGVPRYFLHTSILYVCKQLYEECSKVLYERNEFIVDCLESANARPKLDEDWSSDHVYWHDNLDVYAISDTLVVAKVEFREAIGDEIPEYVFYHGSWDDYHWKGFLSSVNSLEGHVALMKGSLPFNSMESIHLQYDRLLEYAQAFEYNPEFKADLALPPDLEAVFPRLGYPNNIFRGRNLHHIEQNLSVVRKAVLNLNSNIDLFRRSRDQVLLELEKQYQAISRHAFTLNEFIKSEKRYEGFFGLAGWKLKIALTRPYYGTGKISTGSRLRTVKQFVEAHQESLRNEWWDRSTEALFLLEDYADSFARELSFQWRIECRKYGIASLNNHLPRARLLENLKEAYKYRAYNNFVQWFKEVVDDMDGQLIEIRKARQRLFEYENDAKTERVIQADYKEFEAINWGVNEPDMRVKLTIDIARAMGIYNAKARYYS
ncbi:hypothetical protein BCON_0017g00010 [Botryotinia convoluta]|uniref:Uncharacterized protein n=1 Tax=Botryotinia convoluta TaxID=54673 RepID=A0A4Z1IMH1_9HELO|nr:hypothetical protein BCON_0017g00010 [Botryotinia convoluta]